MLFGCVVLFGLHLHLPGERIFHLKVDQLNSRPIFVISDVGIILAGPLGDIS